MTGYMKTILAIASACLVSTEVVAQTQADEFYPPEEMQAARDALRAETGAQKYFFFQTDRFEFQSRRDDEEVILWDINAWYGGRINRLWIKSEAEYDVTSGAFEEVEIQALYSRAITPFFDFQVGIRQDFEPDPTRTHAVIGIQGLAPYWFEIDGALFLSNEGEVTGAFEAEYEFLLTQKWILQPRAELNWSAETIPELDTGSGLTNAGIGLRLRYEIKREFAPYVGIEWSRQFGDTADFARANGVRVEDTALVVGLRLWF